MVCRVTSGQGTVTRVYKHWQPTTGTLVYKHGETLAEWSGGGGGGSA